MCFSGIKCTFCNLGVSVLWKPVNADTFLAVTCLCRKYFQQRQPEIGVHWQASIIEVFTRKGSTVFTTNEIISSLRDFSYRGRVG